MATQYSGYNRQQLIALVNSAVAKDPAYASSPKSQQDLAYAVNRALDAAHVSVTEKGHFYNDIEYQPQQGQIQEKGWWGRHKALGTGLVVGGAAAGGALAAGAAGAAGASSSVPTYGAGAPAYGAGGATGAKAALSVPKILSTANQVSGPLSALSSGRQYGQERELAMQQRQQQLDMEAPLYRARQAVKGDELANTQDFQWGPPTWMGPIPIPTSTGGRRPSILSPQTRELGRQMSQDALNSQRNPPGMPKKGRYDSILDNAAMYSSLLGSFYHPKVA